MLVWGKVFSGSGFSGFEGFDEVRDERETSIGVGDVYLYILFTYKKN